MSVIMRKFNSLVLTLCLISCTANKNDVNVVDRSISETESSTTPKDEISPVKTKFVWRNSLGGEFPGMQSYVAKGFKYEYHSSFIIYNKLVGTLTRISTVIAISVLGSQQMVVERKI